MSQPAPKHVCGTWFFLLVRLHPADGVAKSSAGKEKSADKAALTHPPCQESSGACKPETACRTQPRPHGRHGKRKSPGRPAARPQPPTKRLEAGRYPGLRTAAGGAWRATLAAKPRPSHTRPEAAKAVIRERNAVTAARQGSARAIGLGNPLTVAGAAQALRPARMQKAWPGARTCFPFNPANARKRLREHLSSRPPPAVAARPGQHAGGGGGDCAASLPNPPAAGHETVLPPPALRHALPHRTRNQRPASIDGAAPALISLPI